VVPAPTKADTASVNIVLDETDKRILNAMQPVFPICRSPYKEIGRLAGVDESEALTRLKSLRERGVIRRVGGVLHSHNLGMCTTLVAVKVQPERFDEVAKIINSYPNVTHNYRRDFEYNMWFTAAAYTREKLTALLAEIKETDGIKELLDLPSIRTYKINVQMNFKS